MSVSAMPSVRYSISGSAAGLTKGRTARDFTREARLKAGRLPLSPPETTVGSDAAADARPARIGTSSAADAGRRAGDFSRQRATRSSSSRGTSGLVRDGGAGSSRRIAAIRSKTLAPVNAGRPVSISESTQPSAKRSLCGPALSPRTCSGDMYPTVPSTVPGRVGSGVVGAEVGWFSEASSRTQRASPKSRILMRFSAVTKTFSGFRSRWTIPRECAAARPSASGGRELRGLPPRQASGRQAAPKRLAVQELRDRERDAAVRAEVVDAREGSGGRAPRSPAPRARSERAPRRLRRAARAAP